MRRLYYFIALVLFAKSAFPQKKYDPELKIKLDSIFNEDQKFRGLLPVLSKRMEDSLAWKYNLSSSSMVRNYLVMLQQNIDSTNLTFLETVIRERGYPGKSIVGTPTNEVAWYVIQHSKKIKKYFPLIRRAGALGELPDSLVAKMQDRIQVAEDSPQVYGTQMILVPIYDSNTHKAIDKYYVWPIRDYKQVNAFRKKAGFIETVEENAKRLNATFTHITVRQIKSMMAVRIQDEDQSTSIKEKVRKAALVRPPKYELPTSTFRYLELMDSFSSRRDSVRAGIFLSKVDPYELFYLGQTPQTIKSYLNRFSLTNLVKERYIEHFNEIYLRPKSDFYTRFKTMSLTTRNLIGRQDSLPIELRVQNDRRINLNDSVNSEYLFNYVTKNGWPNLDNGSLYAVDIALRDIAHCYDYISIIYQAFLAGQVSSYAVKAICFNRNYYSDYSYLSAKFRLPFRKIDVSSMLSGQMPANKNEIIRIVRDNCPIDDVAIVLESPRTIYKTKNVTWQTDSGEYFQKLFLDFLSKLFDNCFEWYQSRTSHELYPYCIPFDGKKDRLTLYIFFKEPERP